MLTPPPAPGWPPLRSHLDGPATSSDTWTADDVAGIGWTTRGSCGGAEHTAALCGIGGAAAVAEAAAADGDPIVVNADDPAALDGRGAQDATTDAFSAAADTRGEVVAAGDQGVARLTAGAKPGAVGSLVGRGTAGGAGGVGGSWLGGGRGYRPVCSPSAATARTASPDGWAALDTGVGAGGDAKAAVAAGHGVAAAVATVGPSEAEVAGVTGQAVYANN